MKKFNLTTKQKLINFMPNKKKSIYKIKLLNLFSLFSSSNFYSPFFIVLFLVSHANWVKAQENSHVYTNIQSTATLTSTCIISTNNAYFGTVNTSANIDKNMPNLFTTNCTKGTLYSLSLNGGSSGNINQRSMVGAMSQDKLDYQVYTDNTYSTVWGDGVIGQNKTFSGDSTPLSYYFYIKLPMKQFVTPDTYMDNLTVTLSY